MIKNFRNLRSVQKCAQNTGSNVPQLFFLERNKVPKANEHTNI